VEERLNKLNSANQKLFFFPKVEWMNETFDSNMFKEIERFNFASNLRLLVSHSVNAGVYQQK
jgi:hypothetical protein